MKRTIVAIITLMFLIGVAAPATADSSNSYTYNFWGEAVPSPEPYVLERTIKGEDLNIGAFRTPQDIYVAKDERIYIADTGNSRIVVLNKQLEVERVITEFTNGSKTDAFNQPEGVFADPEGRILVADTMNRRIVVLEADGSFIREMGAPESTLLRQGFQYTPIKVIIDRAERLYVISRGSYEGIMEFNSDGVFSGFLGTNLVKYDPIDLLWKRISTQAQRDQMALFIPLEFNNLDLDSNGFIYTTTAEENSDQPIKMLNPSGVDILRMRGYFTPKGDLKTLEVGNKAGSSIFVDVAADAGGIYNVLDNKRGRIFTYDKDGHLLYTFGALGSQRDSFRTPSAIDTRGDQIVILDKDYAKLMIFEPTVYGSLIREASISLYNGDTEQSNAAWEKVLQLNANFDVGYIGIGKALLKKEENREAMTYFKLGNNREFYSEAFKRYRKEIIMEKFSVIVSVIAATIVLVFAVIKLSRRKVASRYYEEVGVLKNPFYTMIHPFNGFWEMKYEGKGRLKMALGILMALLIATILRRQYSGFIVNYNRLDELNSLMELQYIILPFLLWCVANWLLTTLMDGEGTFKEIVMATGYALMPMVVIYLPQILFSRVISVDESAFYHLLSAIALIWAAGLLFVGTMTVHQYTAGKTIITMILTVVVIAFLIFLGVLFFNMMQQMLSLIISIYSELKFRI